MVIELKFIPVITRANYVVGLYRIWQISRLVLNLSILAIDGQFVLVFGTSASSPVVGSMITLINDARIAAGKGPVGVSPISLRRCRQAKFMT